MIDRRVENGTFFHPRQRVIIVADDVKFIFPVFGWEFNFIHDVDNLEHVDKELWKEISDRAEGEFTRQVKIKLGIAKKADYI